MAAKISISVPDEALLDWAKKKAELEGTSLSAVYNDAVRLARQKEARARVLEWLGPASELTAEREAEIRDELGLQPLPEKRSNRRPKKRKKRG